MKIGLGSRGHSPGDPTIRSVSVVVVSRTVPRPRGIVIRVLRTDLSTFLHRRLLLILRRL